MDLRILEDSDWMTEEGSLLQNCLEERNLFKKESLQNEERHLLKKLDLQKTIETKSSVTKSSFTKSRVTKRRVTKSSFTK